MPKPPYYHSLLQFCVLFCNTQDLLLITYKLLSQRLLSVLVVEHQLRRILSRQREQTRHSLRQMLLHDFNRVLLPRIGPFTNTDEELSTLVIIAVFFENLVSRLMDALENVFGHYRGAGRLTEMMEVENDAQKLLRELGFPSRNLRFLLWLVLNGWKASGLKQ